MDPTTITESCLTNHISVILIVPRGRLDPIREGLLEATRSETDGGMTMGRSSGSGPKDKVKDDI